ncbi:MAG: hypothetical protein WBB07_23290 [Mycobacterium sp.]
MVVRVVEADSDVATIGKAGLPADEVLVDGHLVVAAALHDEHRIVELRGHHRWVVTA